MVYLFVSMFTHYIPIGRSGPPPCLSSCFYSEVRLSDFLRAAFEIFSDFIETAVTESEVSLRPFYLISLPFNHDSSQR